MKRRLLVLFSAILLTACATPAQQSPLSEPGVATQSLRSESAGIESANDSITDRAVQAGKYKGLNVVPVTSPTPTPKASPTLDPATPPAPHVTEKPAVKPPPLNCPSGKKSQNRAARLKTLDDVMEWARELVPTIAEVPSAETVDIAREYVMIFAPAHVKDTTPFVSMDRDCWSNFYEAKKYIEIKEEKKAREYAEFWHSCLQSRFPERVQLAQPYYSCFGYTAPKSEVNPKTEAP